MWCYRRQSGPSTNCKSSHNVPPIKLVSSYPLRRRHSQQLSSSLPSSQSSPLLSSLSSSYPSHHHTSSLPTSLLSAATVAGVYIRSNLSKYNKTAIAIVFWASNSVCVYCSIWVLFSRCLFYSPVIFMRYISYSYCFVNFILSSKFVVVNEKYGNH